MIKKFAIALVLGLPSALAAQVDSLIGTWASDVTYGPVLRGALDVRGTGAEWRASIATAQTTFRPSGDSIRFQFSGLGEFRGVLEQGGRISGWWVQPYGVIIGYPFATRVVLERRAAQHWQGDVAPLADRFSLYLSVWRRSDGQLIGAFRNPELNMHGGANQYRVRSGKADSIVFVAGPDTAPYAREAGVLSNDRRRLQFDWPFFNRALPITLRRVPDDAALGLQPRLPQTSRYTYSMPAQLNDGWKTASAIEAGFDAAALERLVQRIVDSIPTAPRPTLIHSLLIARRGTLILEEYFYGHDREQPHDIRSIGKTFGNVMLGALMQQGVKTDENTRLMHLVQQRGPIANSNARKQAITLGQLMTHTSGLACDDNEETPGSEWVLQEQNDWVKYMLDLPMTNEPGAYYAYCSGGSNLLGTALSAAAHMWLPELFDRTIARPLQFGRYHFNLTPSHEGYLGGGAYLRPRDLLKIGQLYLDKGVWNGRRIVPETWVTKSVNKQVEWPHRGENVNAGTDGYAWHLNNLQAGSKTYVEYEANGNGGQLLIVVPEKELVVVFTAGNYMHGGVWMTYRNDLVPNWIIAAMTN